MLYKLEKGQNSSGSITPLPFTGFSLEKELEDLLAKNLWDLLFEYNELMPIFQERARQEEADIYALNKQGDLVIFELKRNHTGSGAVHQALRYCETAAHFEYDKLQSMFLKYNKGQSDNLQEEHRNAFDLERKLDKSAFNQNQHLIIVGVAGDDELVRNIDYWKSKNISISFIPYRIYQIGSDYYFEFFSPPHDRHSNPGSVKGVLFDTNKSYDPQAVKYMCSNNRVAAFGSQKHIINYLGKNDTVFLYEKGKGIISAGRIQSNKISTDESRDALYHNLEWLTAKPIEGTDYKFMPAWMIKETLGRNFFWARTIKTPYLSNIESETLLKALIDVVGPK